MSAAVRPRAARRVPLALVAIVAAGFSAGAGGALAQQGTGVQTVIRAGSRPAVPGPATRFTGRSR